MENAMWRCLGYRTRALCTTISHHSDDEEAYKVAVSTLNKLQTNAAVLDLVRHRKADLRVPEYNRMQQYLQRVGLTPADLQRLNAIHVSGTKGKGSVCAMAENILRHHSYKTGLFTSPHLLEVRERMRINGKPLSRAAFVYYFWDVYNKLHNTRHLYDGAMPAYFRFLTVMAFSVFLQNKVDVAIIEVGIGGTHDSTNIIENPVVCGITSLGYDHTDILGSTLSDIAWHKGGICKEHCPVITVEQPPEAMAALSSRAQELGAQSFCVAPPLSSYPGPPPELGLRGKHQATNASLAAQLCHTWLQNHTPSQQTVYRSLSDSCNADTARPFHLTQELREGLQGCQWPGRSQIVELGNVTYYLDGAHTPESMKASADWFLSEMTAPHCRKQPVKVLIFNTTGHRDSAVFLLPLVVCGFKYVVFCPNIAHALDSPSPNSADHTSHMVTYDSQVAHCRANEQCFKEVWSTNIPAASSGEENSRRPEDPITRVFVSVSDTLQFVDSCSPDQVAVLVTGSLHLVGTVMSVLGFTAEDV